MNKKVSKLKSLGLPLALMLACQPLAQAQFIDARLAGLTHAQHQAGSVAFPVATRKVKEVLIDLRNHYQVDILFSDQLVDQYLVPANAVNLQKSLETNLDQVLKPVGLRYKKAKDGAYLVTRQAPVKREASAFMGAEMQFANGGAATALAAAPVHGKVTSETGEPLIGVTVVLKGTTNGTATDVSGNYSLDVPNGGGTLVFSYIGYVTREVATGNRTTVDVTLATDAKALEEVVVVGYGVQQKSLVTGAISSVKSKELETVSSTRVEQALQGRTAGVTVIPGSGAPGSGMSIRIRGAGSNRSSQPLYIVDGVRAGGIEYLDPSEIASIEVLKDAASSAIYGAEGANGVVIITTKTGRKDTSEIHYSAQFGQLSVRPNLMPLMNARQYQQYHEEAKTVGRPTAADVTDPVGTNWFDEIFQTAPQMHHTLNFSGGTDKSTYLVGGNVFTQQGIVGGDKARFDRYTVRLNSDHKIKSWLTIGERLSYAHFKRKGISENTEFGSIIGSALSLDPLTPVTYSGALPAHLQAAINAGRPLTRDANGNYYGISNYLRGEYGNPLARIANTQGGMNQNKVVGNVYADIEPFKGLKFTTRLGLDAAFQREHGWTPTFWYSSESLNTVANGSDTQNNWFNLQWENFATYQRTLGDHTFSLLAGTSAIQNSWNYVGGSYSGLFKEQEAFSYADGTPNDLDKIGSNANKRTMASYFGRATYDYKGKYLLNASVRKDGSSLLAPGYRWKTFPAVSAGWVVSNESFFPAQLTSVMNNLKLRASWGQNGSVSNINIGEWMPAIGVVGRYPDANGNYLVGAAPLSLPNMELAWETSEQVDLGADFGLFNNRITFGTDYYVKTTKGLLTPGVPPGWAGNVLPIVNGGTVENRGWEFELAYRNDSERAFQFEVGGNLTAMKNMVTYLDPNVNEIPGTGVGTGWTATVFDKDYPLWYFRGYKTDGIFQNQGQIDQYLTQTSISPKPKPGDPIVVDTNGDKQITSSDQTMIGSPHPDLLFGTRLNMSYKGLDLLVFVQGSVGNDVLMGFSRTDRPTANRPAFFYEDRWTGEGSTNTWFAANTSSPYVYNSDLMVFDGSFARVRQLQLGYTLPNTLMSKIRVKNARVYVSLDDYFTFTNYPGMDPEAGNGNSNSLGIDRGGYPIPRKALAGLSFNF